MARILINILFILLANVSFGQKFFFGSIEPPAQGGPPTAQIFAYDTKVNSAGNTVNHLVGIPAGTDLVLTTTSDLNNSTSTITSSPSLSWTQRAFGNGNGGSALIYTAHFSSGGTIDVTSNFLGLNAFYTSSVLYAVQYVEPVLGGASATGLGQGTASVNILTTRPNSLLFVCSSNWNAIDGGGSNGDNVAFYGSALKNFYNRDASHATTIHYNYSCPAQTTYQVGFSFPTDDDNGTNTAVYEIRGQ